MTDRGSAYMSTGEAAHYLGLSPPSLRHAVHRHALVPATRTPGGHYRFDPRAVAVYRDTLRAATTATAAAATDRRTTRLPRTVEGRGGHMRRVEWPTAGDDGWLRALHATTGWGLLVLDQGGTIMEINETAARYLGVQPEPASAASLARVLTDAVQADGTPLPDADWPVHAAWRTGTRQETVVGVTAGDGRWRWLLVAAAPMRAGDDADAPVAVVATLIDITARKQEEDDVRRRSLHDALTGLPNRILLLDRLGQALQGGRRTDGGVALLLLDLDRFKEVNDTLGHHAGDVLLRRVVARVEGVLRSADTFARLGGDEFVVVLPHADAPGATRAARAIVDALDRPIDLQGRSVAVGASIGIALAHEHTGADAAASLLHQADLAMYAAKRAGGGYALYTGAEDAHPEAPPTLATVLREAVDPDHPGSALHLLYQPILELASGRIAWITALARLQHPTDGVLLPAHFLPLAEEIGLDYRLAGWVLDTALNDCAAWGRDGLEVGVVVTLSPRMLNNRHLLDGVAALLNAHELPADRLRLHMASVSDSLDQASRLREIARRGVRFSAALSTANRTSLYRCRRLPIDRIVLDGPTTYRLMTGEEEAVGIVETVAVAHALGLSVASSGVASWDEARTWRAWGIDAAQSDCLAPPVPADDVAHLTRAWTGDGLSVAVRDIPTRDDHVVKEG